MATTNDDPVIAALRRPTGYVAPIADVDPLAFRNADPISQAARDAAVQDTTSESGRALRTGLQRFGAIPEALYGAGANLVSPGAGDAALTGAAALQRRAAEGGPRVQSTADVHGVGDAAELVRNQALMAIPDVALALGGGGLGGAAVKGLAKRTGLRAAEEFAARQAERTGAETVSKGVLDRAASKFVPAALDAAEPAVVAGRAAGTVAGQYPSVVAGSVEGAPDASGRLVGGLKGASQEDTAKILLGDLGAAGLGALPEIRLLGRLGGTAAQEAVQKNAQAILPRVAKEAAVQGGLGAATGIAQTAAQFATHKWVNDNVDLMSPAAFQSYLDSAVAGGALGAGLGGATEFGAAAGARLGGGGRTEALDGLRSTIRDNLSKFAAAKDAAFAKAKGTIDQVLGNKEGAPTEGQPVAGDVPEEASTPTARAVDIGTKIGEGAASIHKAATDLFDRINQHLSTDEGRAATESAVKDTFSKVTEPVQAGIQATLDSFKAAMKNAKTPGAQEDVQKAYGKILGEHIDNETPDAATSFTDHLNRLNENDALDDRTDATLGRISDRFESGQDDALAPSDRNAVQNPAKMDSKLQDQLATIVPTDSPLWHFPEAMKPIMASAEKMFTGGDLSAKDHANIDILRRIDPDKVDEWEVAGPKYAALNKGAEHVDAANAEAAPATAEGPTREQLLQDGGVFTENRSSPKARELWASKDPTKNANTIGIEPTQLSGGATRQRALQIDNLISKKLAQEPGQGPLNAFKSVLGDLHLAGVKVDPDTITPGTFYSTRDGEKFSLSPRQAAAMRAELKGGKISAELAKSGEKVAPLKPETPQHDVTHPEPHDQVEEIKGEGDNRVPGPERVPRKAPPENQSGIADVRLEPNPYEKVITEARKAPQGAERSQAMHEAGVKIGTAELAKEQEAGTINDRRFAAETKRLNDPSSGLSRKYLRDAAAGKYDSARVRETAAEDASPDFSNAAAAKAAVRDAAKKLLKNDQPTTKETAAAIKAVQKSSLDGADLTAAEARLLKVAQHASDLVGEQHPYRQALDEARGESKTEPTPERRAAVDKADRTDIGADRKVEGKARLADDEDLGAKIRESAEAAAPSLLRETDAANALLKRMGIEHKVKVTDLPEVETRKSGDYHAGSFVIRLSKTMRGAERVEVLAHELGHHIIRTELARAMGVDPKSIDHLSMHQVFDKMSEHQPELHAALNEDFEKWIEQHGSNLDENAYASFASKKAFFRAEAIRTRNAGDTRTLRDLYKSNPTMLNYTHSFEEFLADHISRALTHTDASPLGKFFKGIADKLKIAYDALFGGKGGKDYAPAPSVEKWMQSLFDRTKLSAEEAIGIPMSKSQAHTGIEAGLHAAAETRLPPAGGGPRSPNGSQPPPAPSPKGLKAMVKFIRYRLPNSARQILDQALSRGKAVRALNEIYKDQPGALKAMRDPEHGLEARIAYAYLARERGLFKSGPKATSALRNLGDDLMSMANLAGTGTFAERIFNDIANGRIESMRAAGKDYDVKAREAAYRGKGQAIANDAADAYAKVTAPLRKVFDASVQRMRQTGVPAIRRIGAMLQRHTGEAGEDPGMLPAITHTTDRYMRAAGKVFGDLNDRELLHAMTALQRQETTHNNPKVQTAMTRAKALFGELAKYGNEAGLDFPTRENYFPVVMDLSDAAKIKSFRDLVSKPEFESRIREVLGKGDKPSTKPHAELVDRLVRAAQGLGSEDAEESTPKTPGFRQQNYRLLDFIYKQGTPEDVKTFASLQTKSPADVFGRYVQPLVRDAEFTRRFGKDGTKLEQAIGEAQKQGATDEQLQQVRTAMDGAMGRVGLDGSPVLRKILGANLADKIANPASKKGIAYTQAYQNARLLPLAVLSSLVDPMGIAVRTGGDFGTAWTGFKTGMKSLVNKHTKAELNDMLQRLGSADDFLASDILNSNFGSKEESGGARKINDFIFHANGLAQWTKATRFMALISAHGFLQKHSAGTSPTSKRYLDELGLRPGDVESDGKNVKVMSDAERAAATPSARARDDRVRNALLRFVDESVLRPTAQQAPNWFADPYVGLVTQYKHFAYAIYDQIAKRVSHEVKNGNVKALIPAMAYVPIIAMSEMLRGGIQYGPSGNPNRKDWGPEDYTAYALDRSGLLGPKLAFQHDAITDTQHGNVPGTSFLGPTVQQGANAVRGRGSVESALPGEALYSHWTGSQP